MRTLVGLALVALLGLPPQAGAALRLELVASGFTSPVAFVPDPLVADTFLVVQQDGLVRVWTSGAVRDEPFLDLREAISRGGERGLLGLAFPPDAAASGRVFVNFTNRGGDTVIARFVRTADNPFAADPQSRLDLQWPNGWRFIEQPYANHNGGNLAFGPDGYLYIGLGDGGAGNDPGNRAQLPRTLLGKMLRVDVNVPGDDPRGYTVPADNPFVGRDGVLPEIWALGYRNPWRYSFDDVGEEGTRALVVGDVGQDAVYRGTNLPPFYRGRYLFGDFGSGRVWSVALSLDPDTREATAFDEIEHTDELGGSRPGLSSFARDLSGELYLVTLGGEIYRIVADEPEKQAPDVEPHRRPSPR